VIKTTPHTKADPEVQTYEQSFTVSMSDLSNGRVDAANNNFAVSVTNTEKNEESKKDFWTTRSYTRNYKYVVSNGAVKREMTNEVKDGELVFNDGSYSYTFNARLSVSNTESLGNTTTEGNYTITPHTTTAKAVGQGAGAPTITVDGVTTIYVENKKEITYEVSAPLDQLGKGTAYYDLKVVRKVNGVAEKTWALYYAFVRFGTYKPDVDELRVLSTEIKRHDDSVEPVAGETKTLSEQGDEKAFTIESYANQYHFRAFWNSPVDADGNDEGEVSGHINVWGSKVTFKDPETGHTEVVDFAGTATSEKSEVLNSVYTRQIYIRCNGEMIKDQVGMVRLTVVE
jgi:hypothetical protein